jgi:Fe-S cluster assembly iron-binding protein IscA
MPRQRVVNCFDEKTEKDRSANINGIDVIYNAGQIFFFAGMVIDYQTNKVEKDLNS